MHEPARNGDGMGVLAFIVLTVVVFAALGLAQKLVERL
ncbi:potassium ABC transporter ATPase [Mycobacterium sp. HUMS_1102779]